MKSTPPRQLVLPPPSSLARYGEIAAAPPFPAPLHLPPQLHLGQLSCWVRERRRSRHTSRQRRRAISAQMISTTPNGHVPARKPYALDRAHPQAKAITKRGPRRSSAYISIMNVNA